MYFYCINAVRGWYGSIPSVLGPVSEVIPGVSDVLVFFPEFFGKRHPIKLPLWKPLTQPRHAPRKRIEEAINANFITQSTLHTPHSAVSVVRLHPFLLFLIEIYRKSLICMSFQSFFEKERNHQSIHILIQMYMCLDTFMDFFFGSIFILIKFHAKERKLLGAHWRYNNLRRNMPAEIRPQNEIGKHTSNGTLR